MTTPDTSRVELAIAEMRGSLDAFRERVGGQLDLLVHRTERNDARAGELAALIGRLDERADAADREHATRTEVERVRTELAEQVTAAKRQAREELAEVKAGLESRATRTLQVLGLLLTGAGLVATVIITIVIN